MPRLLAFYFARRVALTTLLIEAALCIPLVMASLLQSLPPAAVRGGLLYPALLGTLPTVLYLVLPLAVGVAVALEFGRMALDGMLAVLYSIRLSVWELCGPPLIVALAALGIGYFLSSWFAPTHVGEMHDVLNVIRNSLNHRMLEPAHFYTFDKGARTMYFQRWKSADVASGMFIYQYSDEKDEEQIINADEAEFRRNENGVVLVLNHGAMQSRAKDATTLRSANFDQYAFPIGMQGAGALPPRGWHGLFELPLGEFFAAKPNPHWDPRGYAEWMSEAAKRCFIPALAVSHALLALALVLTFSGATGRSAATANAAVIIIPLLHIAIIVGSESLVRENPDLIWLVGAAIIVETCVALLLIARRNAKFPAIRPLAEPELQPTG